MTIFDAYYSEIHSGSIIAKITHTGGELDSKTARFLDLWEKDKKYTVEAFKKFSEKIQQRKDDLRNFLTNLKKDDKTIYAYGAPAKGNTLLNYFNIDHSLIDKAVEINEMKIGNYLPGSHIPITRESEDDLPDYYLLLSHNFEEEIIKRNEDIIASGVKFIVPFPNIKVIKTIGLFKHLSAGVVDVPKQCTSIKIDVGLAGEAPNSAIWLNETTDRFVIGIEPIAYHWKMLKNLETANSKREYPKNFRFIQLDKGIIEFNRQEISKIDSRFSGLHCAIDDVSGKQNFKNFYQMDRDEGASGSSSLLKPSEHHPHFIENIIEVPVISLEYLLEFIDWNRFPFIEHIKTDCEGKDYDVVRSIGKQRYGGDVCFINNRLDFLLSPRVKQEKYQMGLNFKTLGY